MIRVIDRDGRWVLEADHTDRVIAYNGETGVTSRVILLSDPGYADWTYWINVRNADGQPYTKPLTKAVGPGGIALRWDIDALDSLTDGTCQVSLEARKDTAIRRSGVLCLTVARAVSDTQDADILQMEWEAVKQYISSALADADASAELAETSAKAAAGEVDRVLDASSEMQQTYATIKASEAGRVSAESARAAAEQGRSTAERDRVSAEVARAEAETDREDAESARADAEAERVVDEQARAYAEISREEAETGREEAEAERRQLAEYLSSYSSCILTSDVSGTAITVDDAAAALLRRAVVTGDTTESGSGDRGPDNPYTLTGAEPTKITVAGEGEAATDYALPPLGPLYGRAAVRDNYDVLSGTTTRRWVRVELDGTETWRGPTDSYAAYTYNWDAPGSGIGYQTSVCSHFVNVNGAFIAGTGAPGKYCDHPSTGRKYFVSDKPTLEEFRAWLAAQHAAGTPVTILYQLAEPVTETIGEPASISIPAPACTISADAGGMEMTYIQDSNIVIKRMQEAIAALSVKEVHT